MKKLISLGLATLMVALGGVVIYAHDCSTDGHAWSDVVAENCDGYIHYKWYRCEECFEYKNNQDTCNFDCVVYINGGGWGNK